MITKLAIKGTKCSKLHRNQSELAMCEQDWQCKGQLNDEIIIIIIIKIQKLWQTGTI